MWAYKFSDACWLGPASKYARVGVRLREEKVRIALLHNPKAGRSDYSGPKLKRLLRQAGHRVTYYSIKDGGWKSALKDGPDLVVVAGGDGTVAKVARRLIGRETPLSVLPLGTANNLAQALGFEGTVEELIAAVGKGRLYGIDVGEARGPWGKRWIFEGAGAGLLAEYLRSPHPELEGLSSEEQMKRHVLALRRLLTTHRGQRWQFKLDGETLEDRFLLFEAMNTHSIGPALKLAPGAHAGDGHFNLVLVRENDRQTLLDYFEARLRRRKKPPFPLSGRRFRRLQIKWKGAPLHLDDDLWPEKDKTHDKSAELEIRVRAEH